MFACIRQFTYFSGTVISFLVVINKFSLVEKWYSVQVGDSRKKPGRANDAKQRTNACTTKILIMSFSLQNKVRIVTAASLFDGHDAAINIMRRIMQSKGAEIIHLGHNRSVHEIVECAIEEDAQGIAITSYQGGHVEFFKYMKDLLVENGCGHIKIFGGGGGTILPIEIEELHNYGITKNL